MVDLAKSVSTDVVEIRWLETLIMPSLCLSDYFLFVGYTGVDIEIYRPCRGGEKNRVVLFVCIGLYDTD